jgi:anti-sigma factor RsiW
MTCTEFSKRLDAWLAGTLTEADARAFEQHAAECSACGVQLDRVSGISALSREVAPPSSLREATLHAVAQRRAVLRWRRIGTGIVAVAAVALFIVISRPGGSSNPGIPGPPTELIAVARARPELAALDAAEQDVEKALREQPADSALAGDLLRIRRQRDAMQRLVAQVGQ